MKKIILLILIAMMLIACPGPDDDFNPITIETILIGKGNLSGSENIPQQNLIIIDDDAWTQLRSQMDSINDVTSNFSEVEIDFTTHQIIAIFDEIKPNAGHSLDVSVTEYDNEINVIIIDLEPEGNATTVITQPYLIVKIPINDKPIIF